MFSFLILLLIIGLITATGTRQLLSHNSFRSSFFATNHRRVIRSPTFDSQISQQRRTLFPGREVQNWCSNNFSNFPRILFQLGSNPVAVIVCKTFRPLRSILKLSANYDIKSTTLQFKSSLEDPELGGKVTLSDKELGIEKCWQLSVGSVEDFMMRMRVRAAVNFQTRKPYVRLGFGTLSPMHMMEGLCLCKRLPLDGSGGNIKMEIKANVIPPKFEVECPSPEQDLSSCNGDNDFVIKIDEINLILDY